MAYTPINIDNLLAAVKASNKVLMNDEASAAAYAFICGVLMGDIAVGRNAEYVQRHLDEIAESVRIDTENMIASRNAEKGA